MCPGSTLKFLVLPLSLGPFELLHRQRTKGAMTGWRETQGSLGSWSQGRWLPAITRFWGLSPVPGRREGVNSYEKICPMQVDTAANRGEQVLKYV